MKTENGGQEIGLAILGRTDKKRRGSGRLVSLKYGLRHSNEAQ